LGSREGRSRRETGITNRDPERGGAGGRQVVPIGIQRVEEQEGDR
jgi:hypothetical protein